MNQHESQYGKQRQQEQAHRDGTGPGHEDEVVFTGGQADRFPELAPGLVTGCVRSHREWGGMAWRRAFAGRGDQVAPARHLVHQLLSDTACADDAAWVVTELISNALRHTRSGVVRGFFVVEVLRGLHSVRVVVYDLGGRSVPDFDRAQEAARRAVPTQAEDGRGLAGVAELAVRVGIAGDAITGHAVWAEFALSGESSMPEPGEVVLSEPSRNDDAGGASTWPISDELPTNSPAVDVLASSISARAWEEAIVLDPPRGWREVW
ncbi:ATP-binding protein [Nonomuraea sp. LPB2021202275-12-8]|uniref:ATP-binding protein n=1 Tax=Nonomuraea sp. LPB2021202275-12-8 TaxID=3120159 RepID=UPI00300C46DE